jgi:hypothetical protein
MKKIAVALLLLILGGWPARTQLTQSQVQTDLNTMLQSCPGQRCNSAASLRSLLSILTTAIFQAQGSTGLTLSGTPSAGQAPIASGPTTAAWGPVAVSIAAGTPVSGCPPLSVLFNNSNVLGCDTGLTYAGSGGQIQLNQFGILTSPAAATWQFGALDASSPVAQTLRFQGVPAGTLNTAGALTTIKLSPSTGTGAAGSLSIQATPAGGSGTTQNAYVPILGYANDVWTFGTTVHSSIAAGGSSSAFVASSITPSYGWISTGGGADQKTWDAVVVGINYTMRAVNDINSAATNWLVVNRGTGIAITNVTFPTPIVMSGVPTGTPVAALCLDASNNVVKKVGTSC